MKVLCPLLLTVLVLAGAAPAGAMPAAKQAPSRPAAPAPAAPAERLAVHAYTLRHQPANEVIELVRPLLSARGTVELQPGGNTLVIRDSLAALARIVPVLRSYDHPAQPLRLEILVVRASTLRVSPPLASTVPASLEQKLRRLLRYETFELVAQADLRTLEGEQVTYEMGDGYSVRFRIGTLLADQRVKLHGFQVLRGEPGSASQLIHTNLNLWLDQTVTLALAKSEESVNALMVVVTCRSNDAAVRGRLTAEGDRPEPGGGGR